MSYPGPSGASPAYDASPSADDVFIKQEPATDPTLEAQLISQARLLARERDAHADTLDTIATLEQEISRLRSEKVQLQLANTKLQEENDGLLGEKEWLEQDSDDLQTQIRELQRALGGQNRNQRHSATQTDAMAVDHTDEVDNAADARPEAAAASTPAPAATPAPATAPAAAPAPAPAPAATAAAPATTRFCSVCLHSVQNIPASTMRKHLQACGITAQDCVSLTAAQVKAQRKARRASKAASAGKKRSAEEGPVSARLRKRARKD